MIKHLRNLCTLLLLAVASMAWADDVTFSYSDFSGGVSSSGGEISVSNDYVTFAESKGYANTSFVNLYAGGVTTITPKNGATVTSVVITCSASSYNGYQSSGTITASAGNVLGSGTTVTWTGSATEAFTLTHNKQIRMTQVVITYTGGGAVTPTVAAPTFSPEAGAVVEGTEVSITSSTAGATIYYTTDGTTPTTSSTQGNSVVINEATTIKAIAVLDEVSSNVAEAAYTIMDAVKGYVIDFENALESYVDWTFTGVARHSTQITAHGGTYYGVNANSDTSTQGVTAATIQTKASVANPTTFTCYVSKESNNTTNSNWYVEVSEDGSSWTQVSTQSATSMSKGTWTEVTANLGSYNNVYVRLRYDGSTALRAVDDISIVEGGKMTPSVTISATTLLVDATAEVSTDGPAVTLATSDAAVATVSGTTVTGVAAGTATITATWVEADEYEGGSKEFNIIVTEGAGTAESPYTVADANNVLAANGTATDVYVKGIISQVDNVDTSYKNAQYWISDDGTTAGQLEIYRGKFLNGADFTAEDQIQVGDVVVVNGNLLVYSGVNEFAAGSQIVSLEREGAKEFAKLSYSATSFTAKLGEENTFPTLENPNALDVTYESSNTDVATIDENGSITLVAAGETTITAKSAETENYYAGEASYTLTVKEVRALVTVDEEGNTTFDLTDNEWGFPEGSANKVVDEESFSNSGYTIKVAGSTGNGYYFNTDGYLLMGKKDAYLTLPAFDFDVEKIEVTGASSASDKVVQNIFVDEEAVSTETTGAKSINSYEIASDYQAAGNVYTLKVTSAHNTQITEIKVYKKAAAETVTIPVNANFPGTTYSTDKALDFTDVEGITAYIVTDAKGTTVQVTKVPANTGLYLEVAETADEKREFEVPVTTEEVDAVEGNLLIPTDGSSVQSDNTTTYYAYGKQSGKFAFFKVSATKSYTPSANKALLAVPTAESSAKDMIDVNGGATAIDNLQFTIDNAVDAVYNLAGQRVAKAQKGVYIVGGKKIVVR